MMAQSWRAFRAVSRLGHTWRATRSFSLSTQSRSPRRGYHAVIVAASITAGLAFLSTGLLPSTNLDAPPSSSSFSDSSSPRDEQELILKTYVDHMNELRSQAFRGKIYTAKGDLIRWHGITHASNSPSEDEMAHAVLESNGQQRWAFWAVYDGHAGGATSKLLKKTLITEVAKDLLKTDIAKDEEVEGSIKATFKRIDDQIINRGRNVLQKYAKEENPSPFQAEKDILDQAYAGSCALLALYDPAASKLRVAVTGDSRAVLGRFNPSKNCYEAVPMSIDQNGKNPTEKARIDSNHPNEENVINPTNGRVLGLAVSRAFGDSRWKWSEEESVLYEEKFGGRALKPLGRVKTPPYLIAEPEVLATEVKMGVKEESADFLIMATDGFWDHVSSQDAVTCVANWVSAHATGSSPGTPPMRPIESAEDRRLIAPFGQPSPVLWPLDKQSPKYGAWRTEPKDFVYEEHNAATHLVQNAFGGRRRGLFCGAMAEKHPLSRWARDDISVYVIFFGKVGGKKIVDEPSFRVL